jgi:hypothetical protein
MSAGMMIDDFRKRHIELTDCNFATPSYKKSLEIQQGNRSVRKIMSAWRHHHHQPIHVPTAEAKAFLMHHT